MSELSEIRKSRGYKSAKAFAVEVGIPAATYMRYEQKPLTIPCDRLLAIADKLGTSTDAILERVADPNPDTDLYSGDIVIKAADVKLFRQAFEAFLYYVPLGRIIKEQR